MYSTSTCMLEIGKVYVQKCKCYNITKKIVMPLLRTALNEPKTHQSTAGTAEHLATARKAQLGCFHFSIFTTSIIIVFIHLVFKLPVSSFIDMCYLKHLCCFYISSLYLIVSYLPVKYLQSKLNILNLYFTQ